MRFGRALAALIPARGFELLQGRWHQPWLGGTSARANDIWSGPHLSEEGLEVAIRVELHVRDLTTEEDAALLEALDLEGSPPAGGWIRLGGPMGGGRRIKGVWDRQRRKT
ncbi:MAG: hypothetical protein ACLPN6_04200 [Streptosporangiaceae bacterium]